LQHLLHLEHAYASPAAALLCNTLQPLLHNALAAQAE
jgi:hypothetical protein